MKVELLHHTPLEISMEAIRKCHQSQDRSDSMGPKDTGLMEKVGNKMKHSSTLEHVTYNFDITGISRAVLQEFARHRIASLSVKSSRYTLKELKNEKSFFRKGTVDIDKLIIYAEAFDRAKNYIVMTLDYHTDNYSILELELLRRNIARGTKNDIAKYNIPDAYKTELIWSINMRSLQNFLNLRTNPAALWEIRDLAYEVFRQLPEDHKFMLEHCVFDEGENNDG